MGERDYWLALSTVRGIGAVRFRRLLNYFGQLSLAWNASRAELIAAGLTEKLADAVVQKRAGLDPAEFRPPQQESYPNPDLGRRHYPRYLKEIDQPPPVLYYRDPYSRR